MEYGVSVQVGGEDVFAGALYAHAARTYYLAMPFPRIFAYVLRRHHVEIIIHCKSGMHVSARRRFAITEARRHCCRAYRIPGLTGCAHLREA